MSDAAELIAVITAVSALVGSLSAWVVQWGLRAANKRKAMAEAASVEACVSSTLFAEWKKIVEELREEVIRLKAARAESEDRLEAAEARERKLETSLQQARADIHELKAAARAARPKKPPESSNL